MLVTVIFVGLLHTSLSFLHAMSIEYSLRTQISLRYASVLYLIGLQVLINHHKLLTVTLKGKVGGEN